MIPFESIPEPAGRRPVLGHLGGWLGLDNAKTVLGRLLEYANEVGPLARVTLGPARMLVVNDGALAAAVLDDPRANYKGASYILTRAVLDNVLLLNGDAWATNRALYKRALRDVDPVGAAERVTAAWIDRHRTASPLRLDEEVSRLIGNVVGDFVAGMSLPREFEEHRARIQYELAGVGIDLQCQPWAYLSPSRWVALRRAVAYMRALFGEETASRVRAGVDRKDVLGGFLRMGDLQDRERTAAEGAINFFFTAHDVLASSTTWCLHLLARHPEVQERVSDDGELDLAIRESLRLFPGYALFGRTLQDDVEIGEYQGRKGTIVIVSPFVIHRMERHWEKPLAFDPERWRGVDAVVGPAARGQYLPFGSGARGCIASHLAFPLMKTIVRAITKAGRITVADRREPPIRYWGTAYAEGGLPVEWHPR
ncbi:MAG: cytochrome P450 [Polyangiaceae bacterium]